MFFNLFKYCVFTYVLLQYDYMLNIWQGTASLGLNMFQIKARFRQRIMLFTGLGHSTKRGIDKIQITSLKISLKMLNLKMLNYATMVSHNLTSSPHEK